MPTYCLSGVKVIDPSELIAYTPTPETVLVDCPSSKVNGFVSSSGTAGSPAVKVGLPLCGCPCRPVEVSFVLVGVTLVTVG